METISEQLTQAVRAIMCHELDVIVSEDNEWFMEQIDTAVKNYLESKENNSYPVKPHNEEIVFADKVKSVTLTSEALSKHFGDQVSDEVHAVLVDQGITPTVYAWSIVVDIDEYTLSHKED